MAICMLKRCEAKTVMACGSYLGLAYALIFYILLLYVWTVRHASFREYLRRWVGSFPCLGFIEGTNAPAESLPA